MRIALIGSPGSGKGTQALRIAQALDIRGVGTGEIIRRAIRDGTEFGRIAAPLIDAGKFIPDELADEIVRGELADSGDFLLDGYPRTVAQAEWFDGWLKSQSIALDAVIDLSISDDEAVRRILGRRICPNLRCGITFAAPELRFENCPRCGTPPGIRLDDSEEIVRTRLAIFHAVQQPIRDFYRRGGILIEISASAPVDSITERILNSLPLSHRPDHEPIVPCFNGTTTNPPS